MLSLFKREISGFFSSLTGYIVIGLFLLVNTLFLWVIPGPYNIIDSGYADLQAFFTLAPWLFMFLAPALTMRTIAEELHTGTWELLLNKPGGIMHIIIAKWLAGWVLLILSLLPIVISFMSVWHIAVPVGNVDIGKFAGSFIGLVFLGGAFLSVGIWASAQTKSQIVAFLLAFTVCFLLYYGFAIAATFIHSPSIAWLVENAGIQSRFNSMSRGVLDSKDIAYFFIIMIVFITFAKLKLKIR